MEFAPPASAAPMATTADLDKTSALPASTAVAAEPPAPASLAEPAKTVDSVENGMSQPLIKKPTLDTGLFGIPSRDAACYAIYLCIMMDELGTGLTVPIMPFYVLQMGGTPAMVGLMIGAYPLAMMFSSMWMGVVSDIIGRKPVMIVSMVGSTAGFFACAMASTYRALLLSRFSAGLVSGSFPVGEAIIAEMYSSDERPKKMVMLGTIFFMCFTVGPPIGSFLALGPMGLRTPFFVGSIASFFALITGSIALPNTEKLQAMKDESTTLSKARERWDALKKKYVPSADSEAGRVKDDNRWLAVVLLILSGMIFMAMIIMLVSVLSLYTHDIFGWEAIQFGQYTFYTGALFIVGNIVLFGKAQSYFGLLPTGALGGLMILIAQPGFIYVYRGDEAGSGGMGMEQPQDFWVFMVSTTIFCFGFCLGFAPMSPGLADSVDSKIFGVVIGIGSAMAALGRALGPQLWDPLYEFVGKTAPFYAAGALGLLASIFYMTAYYHNRYIDAERAKAGLSSRRKLVNIIFEAVAKNRDDRTIACLSKIHDLVDELLEENGYALHDEDAFELLQSKLTGALTKVQVSNKMAEPVGSKPKYSKFRSLRLSSTLADAQLHKARV